jgi:hypothetical protein
MFVIVGLNTLAYRFVLSELLQRGHAQRVAFLYGARIIHFVLP